MNSQRPGFKLVKTMNQGTSNPICNRLFLQFSDIIDRNLLKLDKAKADEIKNQLFECMKDLLHCEEIMQNHIKLENDTIDILLNKGGLIQENSTIKFDDPTYELIKHFENFLIRSVIALRRTIRIAEICFNQKFDGPKNLLKYLRKALPQDHPDLVMFEKDEGWYKELYDIRGKVEHSCIEINKFDVEIIDNNAMILLPTLKEKGCLLRDFMKVTLQNVFTYSEDFTAIMFGIICIDNIVIVQVPDNKLEEYRNFKYVATLKPEYLEKLNMK